MPYLSLSWKAADISTNGFMNAIKNAFPAAYRDHQELRLRDSRKPRFP